MSANKAIRWIVCWAWPEQPWRLYAVPFSSARKASAYVRQCAALGAIGVRRLSARPVEKEER